MGPSGAGKSSLLSILSARLRNNNSKLTFFGDVNYVLLRLFSMGNLMILNNLQKWLLMFNRMTSFSEHLRSDVIFL